MTSSPKEFSWSWDLSRGCWIIRRHGQTYLELSGDETMTYILRITRMFNGENNGRK